METQPRATFRKGERLAGRKAIDALVEQGTSMSVAPLRLTWRVVEGSSVIPARVAIAVPKKNMRLAVDRNRIRRQLREVYRKNKHRLYALLSGKGLQADLLLVYTGKSMPLYSELESKYLRILDQLEERIR